MVEPTGPTGAATGTGRASLSTLPRRIAQVFLSPGELFEFLRERPLWLDVLLLMVATNVLANLLIPEETLREIIVQNMPSDAEPAQVDALVGFTRTWGFILAVIGTPISVAIVAGVIALAYNVVLGGEARYRQLFSATTHAYIILVAGGLLTLGLLLAGGRQVVLSPALLLPELGEGYFGRFLGRINIFALWTAVVLGIGVGRLYPGRSAGAAAAYLLALYAILVALFAIPGGG